MKKRRSNSPEVQRQIRYCISRIKEKKVFKLDGKPLSYSKKGRLFNLFEKLHGIPFKEHWSDLERAKKIRENTTFEDTYIYFFVNEDYGFCKIGLSKNPFDREKAVQTGCPFPVKLKGFFKGDYQQERKYHRKFSVYKTRGEWFKYEGALKQFCEKNFKGYYDGL